MANLRSTASATISFGMVAVPVKLYTATEAKAGGISFNLLHKCGGKLKQQYICDTDGQVVPREEMVKGYEFAKGQWVTFTPEEISAVEEEATHAIEIAEFIPAGAVDPLHFDKPYFLGPEKGANRAYSLIAAVMRKTGRVAIARYAARGKQYLVMLRPVAGGIVMQQLLYADEVRSIAALEVEEVAVKDAELALAEKIVATISAETFAAANYEDAAKKRLAAVVQAKVDGQDIAPIAAKPAGKVVDLMAALMASLEKAA